MAKQAKRHRTGKRPEITRDIYNAVRKYDRRSFEDWADHIYDCGYEDGKAQAVITIKEARAAGHAAGIETAIGIMAKVKGIGPKKLEEIKAAINKAMEEPKE